MTEARAGSNVSGITIIFVFVYLRVLAVTSLQALYADPLVPAAQISEERCGKEPGMHSSKKWSYVMSCLLCLQPRTEERLRQQTANSKQLALSLISLCLCSFQGLNIPFALS